MGDRVATLDSEMPVGLMKLSRTAEDPIARGDFLGAGKACSILRNASATSRQATANSSNLDLIGRFISYAGLQAGLLLHI